MEQPTVFCWFGVLPELACLFLLFCVVGRSYIFSRRSTSWTLAQQAHLEFNYEPQRAEHGDPRLTTTILYYHCFKGCSLRRGTETRVGTSIAASGDPTRFERSAILGKSSPS